jgi:hypothetical protein
MKNEYAKQRFDPFDPFDALALGVAVAVAFCYYFFC